MFPTSSSITTIFPFLVRVLLKNGVKKWGQILILDVSDNLKTTVVRYFFLKAFKTQDLTPAFHDPSFQAFTFSVFSGCKSRTPPLTIIPAKKKTKTPIIFSPEKNRCPFFFFSLSKRMKRHSGSWDLLSQFSQ